MEFGINEIIWLGYLLFNYTAILMAYRYWGKVGLLLFVPLSVVLANIQVLKMMTLFGIDTIMGNIAFGGVFLVSDILSEIEGKKYARKIVSIGFYNNGIHYCRNELGYCGKTGTGRHISSSSGGNIWDECDRTFSRENNCSEPYSFCSISAFRCMGIPVYKKVEAGLQGYMDKE